MGDNNLALISMIAGVALAVCFVVGTCIGFIPFVGFLSLFLYPVDWILAIVALVTGILGYRQAGLCGGLGLGQSIAGMVIGGLFILMQVVVILMVLVIGGLGLFASILAPLLAQM